MAFSVTKWSLLATGAYGKVWNYETADTRDVVIASGYFNSQSSFLNIGDRIHVRGGVGGSEQHYDLSVFTNAAGVVTTAIVPTDGQAFGLGTAAIRASGNISAQIISAGSTSGSTAAQDTVLAVYSLPAKSFDVANRGVLISAQGSFAANANATKQASIFFNCTTAVVGQAVTGGTKIADTGAVATNGGGWSLAAQVFKYGANGSNTQIALHVQAQVGAAVSALLAPALLTAVESGAILIAVTTRNTTAGTDVIFNFMEVTAMN